MKQIQEKVKDIVEVRKFQALHDFTGDPAATLAGYCFTDGTSELMSKWLDRAVSMHDGRGQALALAGYRGVGKSHFLAVFGALTGNPELRSKISDPHVAAAAQGLLRRRYPVIRVKRGIEATLFAELRSAIGEATGVDAQTLADTPESLLAFAREKLGDMPIILLIDTAIERIARVSRDDGPSLAQIAEAAKDKNIFVGAALDDDIAGADGANSVILRAFSIDYLDQEHLYKVVDRFVFPKIEPKRAVIRDVYEYFREVMPTFRWSEQKFSSLYPLHPAILEVAPYVRLYVHDFALLGFASEAGEKILGRPANSLIALDEVFDSAEAGLRKVEDLAEAFAAYDKLNSDVVAKIPVMQRLQAKLILKALLLLSLDGQGATAGEISSGMLIFDENDPQKAFRTVEEIVRMFAAALPGEVRVYEESGREKRYGLRVSSKDQIKQELEVAAGKYGSDKAVDIIRLLFHERFIDSSFLGVDGSWRSSMDCTLTWRGGIRRGRLVWLQGEEQATAADSEKDFHDWEVIIDLADKEISVPQGPEETPKVLWKPAQLAPEEASALIRYHVLTSDPDFREKFGDQIRATLHSHQVLAGKIINRVFLEDARLVIEGFDYNFTEEARGSGALTEVFATMLEPLFEVRYPKHPFFLAKLGPAEVSLLISDLYSGSRQRSKEAQQLAQTFALPLGLVRLSDGVYLPETAENLEKLETVQTILKLLDEGGNNGSKLSQVYNELKMPPLGLVREAQQLVLAAMVAQRMVEFVTSKGDRITQRSLDLKIIWDDVVGLARPKEITFDKRRLAEWAKFFCADENFKNFDSREDLQRLDTGLRSWLEEWDEAAVLERFAQLPPEKLGGRIWKRAARLGGTLGSAANYVRQYCRGSIAPEECLGRIAELFFGDIAAFRQMTNDLASLAGFIKGADTRDRILAYLAQADITNVAEIENCRELLINAIEKFEATLNESNMREIGYLWSKFQKEYIEHYSSAHNSVMLSHSLQAEADEFIHSDEWWEFENFRDLVPVLGEAADRVLRLRTKMAELGCKANLRALLELTPQCRCAFSLTERESWETLILQIREAAGEARLAFRNYLMLHSSELMKEIKEIVKEASDPQMLAAQNSLLEIFSGSHAERPLNSEEVLLIRAAMTRSGQALPVISNYSSSSGYSDASKADTPGVSIDLGSESLIYS